MINIPDEVQLKLESQARQQGLSISAYFEKLVKVKAFSSTLDSIRSKTIAIIQDNNILNEDDLNKYLNSK